MLELIKKTLLTGIGLAVVTKDKAENFVKDLVEKGELTENEGKDFISSILAKSEQAKKDLEERVETIVNKVLGTMNVATKADIERLEKKIDENE
ncbi:MAG TPA: polyhydroxyalkanoate synthesis regulator [Desulfobacteraceae bacterium]|nr:polyhydroxyalkanoate synthesis regulator [Desulfobacteraceae bacterium]